MVGRVVLSVFCLRKLSQLATDQEARLCKVQSQQVGETLPVQVRLGLVSAVHSHGGGRGECIEGLVHGEQVRGRVGLAQRLQGEVQCVSAINDAGDAASNEIPPL